MAVSDASGETVREPASTRRPALGVSTLAGAALGVLILAGLVWRSNPGSTFNALRSVDPGLLLLAVALNVPVVLVRTYRAQSVLAALSHRVPLARMLLIQLVGQTVSSMTPAASGDLVRAYFWRRDDGVPGARGVSAVAFERVYSFLLLTAVGAGLGLALVAGTPGRLLGMVVILAAVCLPLALARLPEGTGRALLDRIYPLPVVGQVAGRLHDGFGAARDLVRSPAFLARFVALTFILFALNGVQLWLLLHGLGSRLPLWTAIAVFALSQTGGTLSTLPFGLGTMEVVMAALLVRSGLTIGRAAPGAVLLRAVITLPLAIAALGAYFLLEKSHRREHAQSRATRLDELGQRRVV